MQLINRRIIFIVNIKLEKLKVFAYNAAGTIWFELESG
jgi:hypothetical protein